MKRPLAYITACWGVDPTENTEIAAKYSRNGNNPGQRVDYTLRKYVSPIKGGEANVTYRNFSSINAE